MYLVETYLKYLKSAFLLINWWIQWNMANLWYNWVGNYPCCHKNLCCHKLSESISGVWKFYGIGSVTMSPYQIWQSDSVWHDPGARWMEFSWCAHGRPRSRRSIDFDNNRLNTCGASLTALCALLHLLLTQYNNFVIFSFGESWPLESRLIRPALIHNVGILSHSTNHVGWPS